MINNLTGTEGVRVAQNGAGSWLLYGQGEEVNALRLELESLRSAVAHLHIPSDTKAALAAFRQEFLAAQSLNEQSIQELQGNAVGHGKTIVNFGAFPGKTEMTAIVANVNLLASHTILAWPEIVATADHTATDLYLEEFSCEVESVIAGSFVVVIRPKVGLSFGHYQINYLYL